MNFQNHPLLSLVLRALAAVALLLACVWLLLQIWQASKASLASPPAGVIESTLFELNAWRGKGILNAIQSFVVGTLGALAFVSGVHLGFIGRSTRAETLQYLTGTRALAYFVALGGVVAMVFQSAQPETFAPIQAFVLGATWTSVVTSVLPGGSGSKTTPASDLVSASPASIPVPTLNKTASDAEVVI